MSHIQNHLLVTVVGSYQTINMSEIARNCYLCGCNILSIKMNQFGQEMAAILYLSGNWGAIAKMETSLIALEKQLNLTITTRRSQEAIQNEPSHAYHIRVTAIDKPGILSGLTSFLQKQNILITAIYADTYQARTGTSMIDLNIVIQIPYQVHLASLREELLTYCDAHNLDAFLEPERN